MESLNPAEWEVLNATADDPENLEQIFRMLRDSSPSITLCEVADAVHTLVEKGLLAARGEAGGQPLPLTSDLGSVEALVRDDTSRQGGLGRSRTRKVIRDNNSRRAGPTSEPGRTSPLTFPWRTSRKPSRDVQELPERIPAE